MKIDSKEFRNILGNYPTGVCVITSFLPNGQPIGMTVGSFTSVSLDPPLIGFFSDHKSQTWQHIAKIKKFCVNILSEDQQNLGKQFSSRAEDKFDGVSFDLSDNGLPIFPNIVSWIDCELHDVVETGDHFLALGHVQNIALNDNQRPLIFYQGQFDGIEKK